LSKLGKPRTSKGLALLCAKIADSKLSRDIIVMNLTQIENSPADYFVICTCDSDVQVEAVATAIFRTTKELGLGKPSVEGLESKQWVLIDFFDVVCHIMLQPTRNYYKLEKLWGDSIFLRLNDSGELRALKKDDLLSVIREKILD